jgi:hypothetical protein
MPNDPFAVLIDGSFGHTVARSFASSRPDYRVFVNFVIGQLVSAGERDVSPETVAVHLWTSAPIGEHEGFRRFVRFLEDQLRFKVYSTVGSQSYLADLRNVLEPPLLEKANQRLQRHDVLIAYVIGRLADSHRLAVFSDSVGVADVLAAAARKRGGRNYLIGVARDFGKHLIDLAAADADCLSFIDLESQVADIFPRSKDVVRSRRLPENL